MASCKARDQQDLALCHHFVRRFLSVGKIEKSTDSLIQELEVSIAEKVDVDVNNANLLLSSKSLLLVFRYKKSISWKVLPQCENASAVMEEVASCAVHCFSQADLTNIVTENMLQAAECYSECIRSCFYRVIQMCVSTVNSLHASCG